MPIINIPPKYRFALYIVAAVAALAAPWALKHGWVDANDVQFILGLVALANVLAAAKTDLSGATEDGGPGMGAGVDPEQPTDVASTNTTFMSGKG